MKEAYEDREKYGFTHILLMDDDIVLEPESLFRTYTLLNFLKKRGKGLCSAEDFCVLISLTFSMRMENFVRGDVLVLLSVAMIYGE